MYHVVYLTGAPASGKSTLGARLAESTDAKVFHYSALLRDHLNAKASISLCENDLREKSAQIVTPADVEAVDNFLIREVELLRNRQHVVIDSHAVTKEAYGFRVTAFTRPMLLALNPTIICMLYAEAAEIQRRIGADSGGRPMVSEFQANLHIGLQSQVALYYGLELGLPLYAFDSTRSIDEAEAKLHQLLRK